MAAVVRFIEMLAMESDGEVEVFPRLERPATQFGRLARHAQLQTPAQSTGLTVVACLDRDLTAILPYAFAQVCSFILPTQISNRLVKPLIHKAQM